jgi:ATP-binding cassette subfamily F protein uup
MPMNILVMDNVSKTFGDRIILQNVSVGIEKGEKIGLLGINGSGKSSFLKMVVGWEEPDEGSITKN